MPPGGGGTHAPTVCRLPTSNPCKRIPHGHKPQEVWPPRAIWRQQAGSLLVFAKCSLEPFLLTKGTTNIGRGIEFLIIICANILCGYLYDGDLAFVILKGISSFEFPKRFWRSHPEISLSLFSLSLN
jgi:hypothetical protein